MKADLATLPDLDRITPELLLRYDRPGPRYTSYPTAVEFGAGFTEADYRVKLAAAAARPGDPLSVYVHLPFCHHRCLFCGCNVIISPRTEVSIPYLEFLGREIRMLASVLGPRRGVSQLHWGGGTPTYLSLPQIESLFGRIAADFRILPGAEVALEVDPRVTTPEQVRLLRRLGFNRVSMGVQDFNPEVQAAIARNQTFEETRDLFELCRAEGFGGINIDLIYGLPLQTEASFRHTLEKTLELRPDRLAVYSYAHIPWIRPQQKGISPGELPAAGVKFALFAAAIRAFLGAGYRQIGMDHFALPGDELARAQEEGRLTRNFMGYTTKAAPDMVGLGVSSIGDLEGAFVQNEKKLTRYYAALEEGRFPVERGLLLRGQDRLRRFLITQVMCNFAVSAEDIAREFPGTEFARDFAPEIDALAPHAREGFVEVDGTGLRVTPEGRLFVRNLCMVFDTYLAAKEKSSQPVFSRTI